MTTTQYVFLVPGFFGFVNLGDLLYFAHVQDCLGFQLKARGIDAEIHAVDTHPTASLITRTTLLADSIESISKDGHPVHLIGHSSGGLDIRLLATPGASLNTKIDVNKTAARIKTVTTVSAPHRGTPLASFFSTIFGRQMLKMSSIITASVLRYGHTPLRALLKFVGLLMRLDNKIGLSETVADQIFEQLLGDMSPERRDQVHRFLDQLTIDQALFTQLTEDGAEIFDTTTADRPGVGYGCVITKAAKPTLRSFAAVGLNPYAQATHAVFLALERVTRGAKRPLLPLSFEQQEFFAETYGSLPDERCNDGVVPTRSQIHGKIIHAARCDHLDSIGHFAAPTHKPPHYDWMASTSGFDRPQFESLWSSVATFIADHA